MRESFIVHVSTESWNNKDQVRIEHLLYEALTETTLAQLIMSSLPFILVHAVSRRH